MDAKSIIRFLNLDHAEIILTELVGIVRNARNKVLFKFDILKLFRKRPTQSIYQCPICLSPFVGDISPAPENCPDCCEQFVAKRVAFRQGVHEARRRESTVE